MNNGHATGTSSARFISLGKFADLAGISLSTARYHADSGKLQVARTLGGHRRLEVNSVYEFLGLESQDNHLGKKARVILYCRVSSPGQKENLSRQVKRMTEWACEKFDLKPEDLFIIQECGSAFSARKGLNRAIEMILAGQVSHLCYEVQDRLYRIGSEGALISFLAEKNGVKLLAAKHNIDDSTEKNMLVTELVDYMTVICNRISAQKASDTIRVKVDDEVRDIIVEKYKNGESINSIHGFLRDNGYESNRGREYSYSKIRDTIKEQAELSKLDLPVEKVIAPKREDLREWANSHVVFSSRQTIFTRLAWESFAEWCRQNEFAAPGRTKFTSMMKDEYDLEIGPHYGGYSAFQGAGLILLQGDEKPPRTGLKSWLDSVVQRIKRASESREKI